MFLSKKLTIYKYSNRQFVGTELKFNIQDDKHNQYLTDRFELYSFLVSNKQNNTIVLLANPRSQDCRTLIEKRQRLNEYL